MSVVMEHMIALRHVQTLGSFTCGCNSDYLLDTDGFSCYSKHKPTYHYDY